MGCEAFLSTCQAGLSYFRSEHAALMQKIDQTGAWDKEIEAEFKAGIEKFKATQTY